jgi:NADH-quinone oxidoreductase subunit N
MLFISLNVQIVYFKLMSLVTYLDNALFFNISIFTFSMFLLFSLIFGIRLSSKSELAFPSLLQSFNNFNIFFLLSSLLLFSNSFFIFDNLYFFNQNFQNYFLLIVLFVLVAVYDFHVSRLIIKYELDFLLTCTFLSSICLCFADDFLIFYLAVEFQSLTFYIIASFNRHSEYSTEAGLKYFIFGAVISCFLLLGFALIFLSAGTTSFELITTLTFGFKDYFFSLGFLLILITLFFKIGAAPFHYWLCDVYDGSILSATLLFASAPKIIIFAVLIKMAFVVFQNLHFEFVNFFNFACLTSIFIGTFSAIYQKRLKRLFAYSTIAHTGFILLGFLSASAESTKAIVIYIVIYSLLSVLLFSFLIFVSTSHQNFPKYLINWTSFGLKNYFAALTFTMVMFSIAGIPPLAGFFSKFFVLLAAITNNYLITSFIVIIISSIACFYYIRLIKIFFFSANSKNSFWLSSLKPKKGFEPLQLNYEFKTLTKLCYFGKIWDFVKFS